MWLGEAKGSVFSFFSGSLEEQRLEGLALESGCGCDVLRKVFVRSGDWDIARRVTGGFVENSLPQQKPLFLKAFSHRCHPTLHLLTRVLS